MGNEACESIYATSKEGSEFIRECIYEYSVGRLVKELPNVADGLKEVHRRIIFLANQNHRKEELGSLIAAVKAFHPHGDDAIKLAADLMAQTFQHAIPYLEYEGSTGSYEGAKPAAARYIVYGMTDFAKTIFMDEVDNTTIPVTYNSTVKRYEPKHYIARLPTALFFGSYAVVSGYVTVPTTLNIQSVCELVKLYSQWYKNKSVGSTFYPHENPELLIPDLPIRSRLKNKDQLLEAYRQGQWNCPLSLEPYAEIHSDFVDVHTLPLRVSFSKFESNLVDRSKDKKSWFEGKSTGITNLATKDSDLKFKIELKRSVNPFEYYEQLVKAYGFDYKIHPKRNHITSDKKVFNYSPLELLENWYTLRRTSVASSIKNKINAQYNKYLLYQALLIIRPHHDAVYQLFKSSKNKKTVINALIDEYKLLRQQAYAVADMRFSEITADAEDELNAKMDACQRRIDDLNYDLKRIDDIIYDDANKLLKRFGPDAPRKCTYESYKGYVKIAGKGIVQFETIDEMYNILKRFSTGSFVVYPKNTRILVEDNSGALSISYEKEPPRISRCSDIHGLTFYPKYTAVIGKNVFCYCDGIKSKAAADDLRCIPITTQVLTLSKRGQLNITDINELPKRKTVCKGAKSDIVDCTSNIYNDMIVVICNSKEPNTLRLARVSDTDSLKVAIPAGGSTFLLATAPATNDAIYVSPPNECLHRTQYKYIIFNDVCKRLGKNAQTYVEFTKTTKDVRKVTDAEFNKCLKITFK